MKRRNRNTKGIMAVIAIFVTLSLILGVVMAATQTNAPAADESMGGDVSSENISADSEEQISSDAESGAEEDNEADSDSATEDSNPQSTVQPTAAPTAQPTVKPSEEPYTPPISDISSDMYSAMWISYLEFQSVDFSSRDAFDKDMTEIFRNCRDTGLNTVIVQVRPFGDALYDSDIFPTSHLITGTGGGYIL